MTDTRGETNRLVLFMLVWITYLSDKVLTPWKVAAVANITVEWLSIKSVATCPCRYIILNIRSHAPSPFFPCPFWHVVYYQQHPLPLFFLCHIHSVSITHYLHPYLISLAINKVITLLPGVCCGKKTNHDKSFFTRPREMCSILFFMNPFLLFLFTILSCTLYVHRETSWIIRFGNFREGCCTLGSIQSH
jgi:hypothetical protein